MVLVNASVLIPLAKTGNLELLKKYFKKIKISVEIKEELIGFNMPGKIEIENGMQDWIKEVKHAKNFTQTKQLALKENLSVADASLLLHAKEQKEKILTNDYRLHLVAKTMQIETAWLTTFLLWCVNKKILSKKEAQKALLELVIAGMRLKVEVYAAIEKKIEEL